MMVCAEGDVPASGQSPVAQPEGFSLAAMTSERGSEAAMTSPAFGVAISESQEAHRSPGD